MFARSRRTESVSEPSWFRTALDQKPDVLGVDVQGCQIRSRVWGDANLPPLVFVHGGGAHSAWWDHIAPFFSRTHRVIAPDLSGHGNSEYRPAYDLDTWAAEVLAVSAAASSSGRPKIVGHSLGGWVTARAAMTYGKQIDSILVIDSPLRESAPEEALLRSRNRLVTGYRTQSEIVARFREVPAQAVILPYIARHIALDSVRKSATGWTWKFDPAIFCTNLIAETPSGQELLEETMSRMPCRQGYLRCEDGVVTQAMADRIRSVMQLRGPFVELAEAGHHPMLDQPLPLVAALRTLLEFWSIT
jgi:pimeloyl-ACP methyl ester carboxylesterase